LGRGRLEPGQRHINRHNIDSKRVVRQDVDGKAGTAPSDLPGHQDIKIQ
jgi:hypothetical protein